MLYATLILSGLLLLACNIAAWIPSRPVIKTAFGGLALSFVAVFTCMGLSTPTVLLALFLCPIGLWWKWSCRSPNAYLSLSLVALVLAFIAPTAYAVREQLEYSRMRERFPFESMDGHVPLLPVSEPGTIRFDSKALETEDREITAMVEYTFYGRSNALKVIHEHSVSSFVNSPGFGVTRMMRGPTVQDAERGFRFDPAPFPPEDDSYRDQRLVSAPGKDLFGTLHRSGVLDFVHPDGFGHVKDRQHVAGFQSHRFSKVPESGAWTIERLDLVSLLMHKEPGVYVSERLPQMDALKGVPLRPLDEFEQEGLKALREGEDLHIRDQRMLGSIRSTKQCIACHGGERGQLLGAFSYTLRPTRK